MVALVGLAALALACNGDGKEAIERLFAPQGNQLDVYDLETGASSVLIAAEDNTVNWQVCLLPDGSGNFLLGEDTNQPDPDDPSKEGDRQGWGIFTPEGEFVRKILEPETEGEADQVEPFGCGFDSEDRLFVTDVGSGSFDADEGKLIVYFPPDYETFCVLDTKIHVAGTVAIDEDGNIYVPETVPPGHVLRFAPPFPAGADECEGVTSNKSVFIEDPDVQTPFSLVAAPNGNWYLSSVFLPTAIREYDADGAFVRTIVEGADVGNPAGLAVASDGTIYYADLGLETKPGELPGPAEGKGTVRKVAFDADGNPLPPETIGSGLDYPDAVSILRVD